MTRTLPSKEQGIFRSVIRFYEHKQYKKGLKACEQILRKYADHGETLAMKGLILNYLERKEEAYDYVRKGLRHDLTSHICWHVYGLLHRANKNYEEAIKCYLNALKHDKDNLQILRDLSLLQVHMRNLEGFNESRHSLLMIRPQNRASWIVLAISYHLLDNHDMAIKVLQAYENTLMGKGEDPIDMELSEMYLYKNLLLFETGRYENALSELERVRNEICDQRSWKEMRAKVLSKLQGKEIEAEEAWMNLLKENGDNKMYYEELLKLKGFNMENVEKTEEERCRLLVYLKDLLTRFVKTDTPKQLALRVAKPYDQFENLVHEYLRKWIRKGAPSLFVSMKSLYQDEEKRGVLERIMLDYEIQLSLHKKFQKDQASEEEATCLIWTLFFLSRHFDYLGQSLKALSYLNKALELAPDDVDLLMFQAKIYKHGGNANLAEECMKKARETDLADRYLNTKCAKYMIRNDKINEAEKLIALFAKGEIEGTTNLMDMQCMWYALETGKTYFRRQDYGQALKKFHQIDKYFEDMLEDQFDFHAYCVRKMTLRAYISMLKFEDNIYGHDFYIRAACNAIRCYLDLHDNPEYATEKKQDSELASLSESERKKFLSKQKRAEAKARSGEEMNDKGTMIGSTMNATMPLNTKSMDVDPLGKKFLGSDKNYLGEAIKFLHHLRQHASQLIETHILTAEVYRRLSKTMAILQALSHGFSLQKDNPLLHKNAVLFLHNSPKYTPSHPMLEEAYQMSFSSLFHTMNAEQYNDLFLQRYGDSLPHLLVGVEMMNMLDATRQNDAIQLLVQFDFNSVLSSSTPRSRPSLDTCRAALHLLTHVFQAKEHAIAFTHKAQLLYPWL